MTKNLKTIFASSMFTEKNETWAPNWTKEAYLSLESFFSKVKETNEALKALQGLQEEISLEESQTFEKNIENFPIEATLIRMEIKYPNIPNENLYELQNTILSNIINQKIISKAPLKKDTKITLSTTLSDYLGPRSSNTQLKHYDIYALIQLWELCDKITEEYLANIPQDDLDNLFNTPKDPSPKH